jgi:acyl dehydratase
VHFKEFSVGQVLNVGPVTVGAAAIIDFASAYDPQPFHTDPALAQQSRWKGLIASGWHTCTMAMRLMCDGPLKGSESMGSPGLSYLKWPAPVRPGDTLRLQAHVLEKGPSKSGRVGVLRWRWVLINQADETVLDLEATSLFDLSLQPESGS